jgi:DNA primase
VSFSNFIGSRSLGRISDAQVDLIRQRADLVAVIGERVALEKKGRDFVGRCPFHEEKTGSFYVNPQKQAWYCHGSCKKGGDVFTFVREIEKVRFPDAVRLVARRFGVDIEDETPEERARSKRKADLLDVLNRAVEFYKKSLWSEKDPVAESARAFLKRRGMTEETARAFSLGVAPRNNALARKAGKVPGMLPLLREHGLVRADGRDFFSNRLLFPIADESGRWIAFGGRRLDEKDEPKFVNSRDVPGIFEKKRVLYGLDRARDARPRPERLVVVEGYMDVVIAHQAGCKNVVAALGTGFTPQHATLAKRFVDGVVLLFDGDKAGQTANRKVFEQLLDLDLDTRVATLPGNVDPDDLLLKDGKEAFDKLVNEGSRDIFQYLVEVTTAGKPVTSDVVKECAELLGKFKDDIRHQLSLKFVSDKLRIPEDLLRKKALESREAGRKLPGRGGQQSALERERAEQIEEHTDPQVREILGPHACAGDAFEVALLEALLARPQLANTAAAEVHADDFTRGPLREVASLILRLARNAAAELAKGEDEAFIARVLSQVGDFGTEPGIVARLLARIHEQTGKNYEAELEGVRTLVARRKKVRAAQLQQQIEEASGRGDWATVERLQGEKRVLERDKDTARRAQAAGARPPQQREHET